MKSTSGTYSGGTFNEDTCQQENYYYDAGQYGLGRLTSMQYQGGLAYAFGNPSCDHTFTETFTYNSPGGLTSQSLGVSEPAQNYSQGGNISMALTANYAYDNEGRVITTQYPSSWNGSSWVSGPNLGNTFDGMGRLQKLTDLGASSDIIANATYAPTGQLLTMTRASGAPSETRTYNSIGQMTQLQSGSLNVQYAYSATQNNGKITSETDVVSGEQIAYTYDSLNRLASATSSVNPGWGQSYNYDGFGNLTDQNVTSGTAPALHVTYDPATNRQTGECADANGNLCGSYYSYDVENRFVRKGASFSVTPDVAYSYRPGNKRVWKGANYVVNQNNWSLPSTDEVTFWSINGQKLATYSLSQYQPGGYYTQPQLVATQTGTNYYFGGKLVKNLTGYVTPDRLGSIGKYFPYGQERPSATQDGKEKFATYFRDSETGLDYADQRYHQPGMGRFMTSDESGKNEDPSNPGSFNKYAYVNGDPINASDPTGEGPSGLGMLYQLSFQSGIYNPYFGAFGVSYSGWLTLYDAYLLAYQGGGGGGPAGANPGPGFADFSKSQDGQVQKAFDIATGWTNNAKCNNALKSKGVTLKDALDRLHIDGSNQNVWDGTKSTYEFTFDTKPLPVHESVETYFKAFSTVNGAVTLHTPDHGDQVFLGQAFFNPGLAGVTNTQYQNAEALMLLHEAVHLLGPQFGDAAFGGSKALTNILIQNCTSPVLAGQLGGLNF